MGTTLGKALLRKRRAATGQCVDCGVQADAYRCDSCREKSNRGVRKALGAMRERARREGLCTRCGKHPALMKPDGSGRYSRCGICRCKGR